MKKYVEIWNVSKAFPAEEGSGKGPVTVVRDFDLSLREGEFVSIIGPSGCGKSTVLSIVAGLTEMTGGGVIVAGREIDGAGPDRGVVFQAPCLLPWMTALENVLLGVERVLPRASHVVHVEYATRYLALVGLEDALGRKPAELSVGMRQRVALARAFALRPKVLLLDEPFGMLDSLTRLELQEALVELGHRHPRTTLMVTHDVDEALFLSDRIAMMTGGPEATIGGTLDVPLPRPRMRSVADDPVYQGLRASLIDFLEQQMPAPAPALEEVSAAV